MINTASANNLSALDRELEEMIGNTGTKIPGLGVIVFKDGREVYSKFLGRRHIDKDLPVTRDTRFRCASISKMFTMFTIMQLVDEGKIDLEADVSKYLGFTLRNPNFLETPITVRMLASHTSSLRDGIMYGISADYSVEEFFKPNGVCYDNGLHFAPKNEPVGQYFKYSNLNYNLLGTIIEKVTGERFDLYQKRHILSQLDTHADYVVGNLSKNEFYNLGTIYQKNDRGVWNENFDWIARADDYSKQPEKDNISFRLTDDGDTFVDYYNLRNYKVGTNATIFAPAGGLRISFEELSHCLQMLMNGGVYNGRQVIKRELLEEMMTPQWIYNGENGDSYDVMFNYCLGIYKINGNSRARLCKDYKIDLIGHSGEAYGLISGLYFIPGTKNGVIFMTNGEAIEIDNDPRSLGKFSNSYIWEENLMNPICKYIFKQ